MRMTSTLLRVVLASLVPLLAACATSRARISADEGLSQEHAHAGVPRYSESHATGPRGTNAPAIDDGLAESLADGLTEAEPPPVLLDTLPGGRLRLSFPAWVPHHLEALRVEEVRPLLAAFDSFRPRPNPRLRLMMLESPGSASSGQGPPASWEPRLREDFFSRFGPPLLPISEPLETSRLFLALKLSTRYMDDGIREAAQELFSSPLFLASVALSITVYFASWLAPETASKHLYSLEWA
jgi:hypothetical protein